MVLLVLSSSPPQLAVQHRRENGSQNLQLSLTMFFFCCICSCSLSIFSSLSLSAAFSLFVFICKICINCYDYPVLTIMTFTLVNDWERGQNCYDHPVITILTVGLWREVITFMTSRSKQLRPLL